MGRKALAGILAVLLLCGMAGCGRVKAPQEETTAGTTQLNEPFSEIEPVEETVSYYDVGESELWSPEMEEAKYMEKASFAAGSWQYAYAVFLKNPENYKEEDPYRTSSFVLADLDNDGSPELILMYGDGIQGGVIFANVYSCSDKVNIIGRQIDMYYKNVFLSTDPAFSGVFVEGGRNSTFSCNYWTIKDNKFIDIPLWTNAPGSESEGMVYTELTDNKQLIAEADKVISLYPYGIEYSGIDEAAIQMVSAAE